MTLQVNGRFDLKNKNIFSTKQDQQANLGAIRLFIYKLNLIVYLRSIWIKFFLLKFRSNIRILDTTI